MSAPKRYLVDTNVLLRFLTGEPPQQANAVRKLFTRAQAGELVLDILPIVVSEAYYTLTSFYRLERILAAEKISQLLQQRGVSPRDPNLLGGTLSRLKKHNVDFADAYLAAGAEAEKMPVASFDKDFDKFPGVARYEPVP